MEFSQDHLGHSPQIVALFRETFTDSEGAAEGAAIAHLVERLITGTPEADLRTVTAWENGTAVAGLILSRLVPAGDSAPIFLMAPVAVATAQQRQGLGQRLIAQGLALLRAEGAGLVATYGDPAFYGKAGFLPISPETLPPPHPLGQPEGWQALSLSGAPLTPVVGPLRCVAAFDDPAYW